MTPEHGAVPVDQTGATYELQISDLNPSKSPDGSPVNDGDSVQREALRRHAQGWALVQLHPGTKRPVRSDWTTHRYESDLALRRDFPVADPERNVAQLGLGVVLGQRSGGLVVVDLDAADPGIAAPALPPTGLRDGRQGRSNSHWFYRVTGKAEFTKRVFKGSLVDTPLIELLGDGQQVVIPPSLHGSGEHRAWVEDGEPATIDADDLLTAAARAAAFQEIALVWQQLGKSKHESALPLVGGLLRAGIDETIIEALLTRIWLSADPNEVRNAVQGTVRKRDEGAAFTGWRRLRELWGDAFAPSITKILSWLGVEGAEDERPVVILSQGRMEEATREAWQALKRCNNPAFLFSQGTSSVRVELDHKGRAGIVPLTVDRMRFHLLEQIRWLGPNRKGDLVRTDAPVELVRNILAAPNAQLPPLTTVTVAPVLSPSGEIQLEPGYHAENQSFYWPLPGFEVLAVSASPSGDEIERAKVLLLDEMLGDFPFEGPAEKANALALLLLPFGRSVIVGPTSIHFIEAPRPGTGKSKLADLITRLISGPTGAASISETTDEEEWRKRITATLATGSPFIFIDNVTQTLNSSNLSSATTKLQWKDRILGKSEEATFDVQVVWIVTANNAAVSLDIARRSVRIRLNAQVEDPFKRPATSFRDPDIEAWVTEHWGELVWASLTLWRAWVSAGKPRGGAVLGSFENWAATMSGLLNVIGVPGFLENRDDFVELATQDTSRWHELVDAWWERYGTDPVRAKELYDEVAIWIDGFEYSKTKENGRTTAFGIELGKQRDNIFGRLQVVSQPTAKGKPGYRLVHLDGQKRTGRDHTPDVRPVSSLFGAMPRERRGEGSM